DDLGDLVKTFRIPLNMHPRLPDPTLIIDRLTHDAIGTLRYIFYNWSLWAVVFRDLGIVLTVTLFCVFNIRVSKEIGYPLPNAGIRRMAILEYLTWRHSHSCVSNDLPIDGYNQNDVERLCARLIRLHEMKEEVLVRPGLSSVWSNRKCDPVFRRKDENSDAKVVEEPHHLPTPLLDSVPQHTTAAADEGALISLPTPDKVAATQPDPRLARRSQGPYKGKARTSSAGLGDADISNFWDEFEGSLERSDSTHVRAVSAHLSYLGKRLGPPPSSSVVAVSELSQIGTSVRAATPVCGIARKGIVWLFLSVVPLCILF
ncbi:hypothetical protein Tco_1529483, partial [Tanacetum coccineum]